MRTITDRIQRHTYTKIQTDSQTDVHTQKDTQRHTHTEAYAHTHRGTHTDVHTKVEKCYCGLAVTIDSGCQKLNYTVVKNSRTYSKEAEM